MYSQTASFLTASVVLYNTPRAQIHALFESIVASGCVRTLYVVDNSPNDKYRILEKEWVGRINVRYIHNANLGYGASHNLAMQEAATLGSDYHVVLNPDIHFEADALTTLTRFMDSRPNAGYVMPKVTYPDGSLQYLCKLLPSQFDLFLLRFLPKRGGLKKLNDRYELRDSGYDKIINPPCLSGCFMFLRLSLLVEQNLFFDERYFMYCEDFDLMRRIHRVAATLYFPNVSIIHNHAKESYKSRKMLAAHIQSAIRYFNKWGWFFDRERKEMNKKIDKNSDSSEIRNELESFFNLEDCFSDE